MKSNPSTEYVLLGTLMRGPRHGYEIMHFLESGLESTWRVGTSQLYALLKRLEQKGNLRSNLETQDTRPSRRVFTLTDTGRKTFMGWIIAPTHQVRHFRLEFISKLFFLHDLSLGGGPELIKAQILVLKKHREEILRREQAEKDPFRKLVYGFKMETVESRLRWLNDRAKKFMAAHEKRINVLFKKKG